MSWVRAGQGLVGWGEAARFEAHGPDRFAEVDRWWRDYVAGVDVHNELGVPGTGPTAFVSMAFADEPGHSVLIVPEVVIGQRDGVSWVTEIGRSAVTRPLAKPVRRPKRVHYTEGELTVDGYRDAVRAAVTRMKAGELGKVVLAHDVLATTDGPIDVRFLLRELAARYPNCWAYAVDGLIGATPELLLRRTGQVVSSRVLAGTTWPRPGVSDDDLAAALLGSRKDQDEHAYAVASLADTLRPFCATMTVDEQPSVLRLHNVLHLSSEVGGILDRETSLLRLSEAVHPTAAVGGTPRQLAIPLIRELEGMDRGRYAGPIGWIDGNGDGEMGVALRCAKVDGSTARLFAGCGIVADSDPDTEVREAAAKLVPMREALEGADRS
ncbi:isochorismate synthase [Solihabitans fulvus]|uniref:isochorismate synthase n=1 Tax=Solihabitans fulvus TaxID=1892852 RepID=A0A5B2XPZ6_9PSEU|nr:isochorismate synthase [Solihabitans fulvus]